LYLCSSTFSTPADPETGGSLASSPTAHGPYNCTDLERLDVRGLAGWGLMLSRTQLSAQTAALAVEMAIAANAPRGLFATSKFCGPVRSPALLRMSRP